MRAFFTLPPAVALALTACVNTTPLSLADDNPASPRASPGPVDIPSAIAGYHSATDLAAGTTVDTEARPASHVGMHHGAMPGMPGMPQGGAPHGAGEH